MRKIIALLLIITAVFFFSACHYEYKVKNETDAEKVYKCSSDNMFGLEKVVVFHDGIVLVFDKETSDRSEYVEFDEVRTDGELYEGAVELLDINGRRLHSRSSFVEENGKYVVSAFYDGDEDDTVINGMHLFEKEVEVNDGNLMLQYYEVIPDAFEYERQYFDTASNKWGASEKDLVPCGTGED